MQRVIAEPITDPAEQAAVDKFRKREKRKQRGQQAKTHRNGARAASNSAAKPVAVTDNKGRDEKYWRTTFQKARDDLKRAEARVEILDLRVKDLNTQLLRRSDMYNRENRLGPEIAAAQKDLEDARKEAEQAKKKITDLEDELRRSGGPAGWGR